MDDKYYDRVRNGSVITVSDTVCNLFVGMQYKLDRSVILLRHEFSAEDILLYTSDFSTIRELNVFNDKANEKIRLLWTEMTYAGDKSEIHYAELTNNFVISRHAILFERESADQYFLPRAITINEMLIVSVVNRGTSKLELFSFDLVGLSQVNSPNVVNEVLNSSYFSERQSYLANIEMTASEEDGTGYLSFIVESGTVRVYKISWDLEESNVQLLKLFDFAFQNIGFHRVLLDKETNRMTIVYSQDKSARNDIRIAQQEIFPSKSEDTSLRSDSIVVNQSTGDYLRPYINKDSNGYNVFWEGEGVYWIKLDPSLNIIKPEEHIAAINPGNVSAINSGGIVLTYQSENDDSTDLGKDVTFIRLTARLEN